MQATTRSKLFVVEHRTFAVAIGMAILISAAGLVTLLLTATSTADHSDVQPGVIEARPSGQQVHRPTDGRGSISGNASLDTSSASDLDQTEQWTAFSGHAGLTNESTSRLDSSSWTTFPGHAGFTIDSTSHLDRTEQMTRFFDAKMARFEAEELNAATMAAQANAARRQLEMDRNDYRDFMRLH
jgi:hypothetical protein